LLTAYATNIQTLTNSDHQLRYVLRNRKTNELLFVVSFTLTPTESGESTPAQSIRSIDSSSKGSEKKDDSDYVKVHPEQKGKKNEDGDYVKVGSGSGGAAEQKADADKKDKETYDFVDEGVD
jgi:hypothetical protein